MDIFNYVSALNPTAIYSILFQASIALAGFIAIFIVFSHQTLDNRVDHRKDILISLLNDKIIIAPYIAVIIQNMNEEAKDPKDLCTKINDQLTEWGTKKDILEKKWKRQ